MPHHFHITEHAIDRFLQRHNPTMTRREIAAAFQRGAPRAVRLRQKTRNGQEQWAFDEPNVVVVVKRDAGRTDRLVGVTILPAPESSIPDDEMEIIQEALEDLRTAATPTPAPKPVLLASQRHINVPAEARVSDEERQLAATRLTEQLSHHDWFLAAEPHRGGSILIRCNRPISDREWTGWWPKFNGIPTQIHAQTGKGNSSVKAVRQRQHQENLRLTLAASIEKDRLKTARHLAKQTKELDHAKGILRRVIGELTSEAPSVDRLLQSLRETDPWLFSDGFLFGPGRDPEQDVHVTIDPV